MSAQLYLEDPTYDLIDLEPTTFSTTPARNTDMFTIERQTSSTRMNPAAEPVLAARSERYDYDRNRVAERQRAIARQHQYAARVRAVDCSADARSTWGTPVAISQW